MLRQELSDEYFATIEQHLVTHLHDFAHRLHSRALRNVMFLRAERRPDGTRTFRMLEAEPLQTSYGKDLFQKVFAAEQAADDPIVQDAVSDEQ